MIFRKKVKEAYKTYEKAFKKAEEESTGVQDPAKVHGTAWELRKAIQGQESIKPVSEDGLTEAERKKKKPFPFMRK